MKKLFFILLLVFLLDSPSKAVDIFKISVKVNKIGRIDIRWKTSYKVKCGFFMRGVSHETKIGVSHHIELEALKRVEKGAKYKFKIIAQCKDGGIMIYFNYFTVPSTLFQKRKKKLIYQKNDIDGYGNGII